MDVGVLCPYEAMHPLFLRQDYAGVLRNCFDTLSEILSTEGMHPEIELNGETKVNTSISWFLRLFGAWQICVAM